MCIPPISPAIWIRYLFGWHGGGWHRRRRNEGLERRGKGSGKSVEQKLRSFHLRPRQLSFGTMLQF